MVAAFALPTMAQNYEAQQPTATFQSTSTFTGSGSTYSSNPTINENGVATTPSYSPARSSGPRRTQSSGDPWGQNQDGGDTSEEGSPIGDAVLPLLLMSLAFVGVTYIRKRRAVK